MTQRQVGLLQLGLTPLKILGHAIERRNQGPDFIRRFGIDLYGQIPMGHRLGGFRQALNRHGDTTGHIKSEPRGTEENQNRHHRHKQIRPGLDRIFHRLDLFIFRILSTDPLHLGQQRLGDVGFDDHDTFDLTTPTRGNHRNRGANQSPGFRLLNRGKLLLAVNDL